jgi:hypothetical protein
MRFKMTKISPFILFITLVFLPLALNSQDDKNRDLPQFLFKSFTDGTVKAKSGSYHKFILNYDMLDEKMIMEQKGVYRLLANPGDVDTISLQGRLFVPVGDVFYEVLVTGGTPFYLQHKCLPIAEGTDIGYGQKSQSVDPTSYRRFELGSDVVNLELPHEMAVLPSPVSWVRINNEMLHFSNSKQFIKLFPGKQKELSEYFKKNKIDFKSREDLIKLGIYFNDRLNK